MEQTTNSNLELSGAANTLTFEMPTLGLFDTCPFGATTTAAATDAATATATATDARLHH